MGLVFCLKFINRGGGVGKRGGVGAPFPHRHALCQLPRKPGIFPKISKSGIMLRWRGRGSCMLIKELPDRHLPLKR